MEIDKNGVPPNRQSKKFNLHHNKKNYPPKYVLSIATKFAIGKGLEASEFNGGKETNGFLQSFGFDIRDGNKTVQSLKKAASSTKINICTVLIQNKNQADSWDKISNTTKFKLLSEILSELNRETDILILPAGFLNSGLLNAKTIFGETEKKITNLLKSRNHDLCICLGIDGLEDKKDQLSLAINKTGIIAIARKFHHIKNRIINLAENPFAKENGKERHFFIKGKKAYLAVCYDVFGISQEKIQNKNDYDFIIASIHGFDNKHNKGDSDFARKGLAGASKQWNVPSFASAVFEDRNPENWPSGVLWERENASVKDFRYEDIRIEAKQKNEIKTDDATLFFRYYH